MITPPLRDRAGCRHSRRSGAALVIRHKAAVADPEPPGSIRLYGDADSGPYHDHLCFVRRKLKSHRPVAKQVTTFVLSVQTECLGEPAGTARKITIACPPAS